MKNILVLSLIVSSIFAVDNPCELPNDHIYLNGGEVWYNVATDIGGFQFNIDGATVSGAAGGDAASSGFVVQASNTTVLGFSFSGGIVPLGCGVLTNLTISGDATGLSGIVMSNPSGQAFNVEYYVSDDSCDDLDEDGICDDEDDCVGEFDECGICNGEGIAPGECDCSGNVDLGCGCGESGPTGCDSQCGSTLEVDDCGVCNGGNADQDCAGICFGDAILDDCGICNGNNDCLNENHYNVTIGETGVSQLLIFQETITELQVGDEIGIFDLNGVINDGNCDPEYGELLVGAGIWSGEQLEVTAISSIDVCDFGGVMRPGFNSGNEIEIRIWRDETEILPEIQYSFGDGEFGELLPDVISGITLCSGIIDECGVCNGDNSTCSDCAGVPNGDAVLDNCGTCDNDSSNDCVQDCAGTWGGDLVLDECGECGGDNSSCSDCAGIPNGDTEIDCAGECGGSAEFDECGICGGDNGTCSGCMDGSATNYDETAIVDDGSCEFPPIEIEEPEELESYNSSVDIDVPEVVFEEVEVDINIPAGALDVPEGTEVTLEASEVSENEIQEIIDNSSSSDAGVEVYEGISFEATDENGEPIELAEGATLDVELTFDPNRNDYDLGYITEDGEIVALGAECEPNDDDSWTCVGDGPGFGSYIVYSYDPSSVVGGCTLMEACNFNPEANMNDGSCTWSSEIYDCDGNCNNDNDGDSICDEFEILGCNDPDATDFNPNATDDDGSCNYLNGYSPYYGPRIDWNTVVSTQQGLVVFESISLNGEPIVNGIDDGSTTGSCPDGNCDIIAAMYNGATVGWSYMPIANNEITIAVNFIYTVNGQIGVGVENYPAYTTNYFEPTITFNFYDASEQRVYYNVSEANPVVQGIAGLGVLNITGDGNYQSCDGNLITENICFELEPGCPLSYDSEFNPNAGIADCNYCNTMYSFCGCTDSETPNYNPDALVNDGSCQYGFNFTHDLAFGNNLISLPGALENNSSQNLLENLMVDGPNVVFLLGQGVGLFNTVDGWSGNLNNIYPTAGYWLNVQGSYSWDIEFASALEPCSPYDIGYGNNLLSYRWGDSNASTLDALGGEEFASNNFNFILGQGVGLFNTADGWSGNLNNLIQGKGYWVNITNSSLDFKWGFDNCQSGAFSSNTNGELEKEMLSEFKFNQSTEQAFYLIKDIKVDGNQIKNGDIVLAYNNDILVGSVFWDGKNTAIPVMGRDLTEQTFGYCELGDIVDFKYYSAEKGEIINLKGEIPFWESLLVTEITKLNGKIEYKNPNDFVIGKAYPNPFNPVTSINYNIPYEGYVNVSIFDVNGKIIETIVNGFQNSGNYNLVWSGIDQSSGLYFIQVNFNNETKIEKIMLVK